MTDTLYLVTDRAGRLRPGDVQVKKGWLVRPADAGEAEFGISRTIRAMRSPEHAAASTFERWPWRLWQVQGDLVVSTGDVVGCQEVRVTRQLPLERAFGPCGTAATRLLRRLEEVTAQEARDLGEAWAAVDRDAMATAVSAAEKAASQAGWSTPWTAALQAIHSVCATADTLRTEPRWDRAGARGVAVHHPPNRAEAAAASVAKALFTTDLVGSCGLRRRHVDLLRQPWLEVLEPVWEPAP